MRGVQAHVVPKKRRWSEEMPAVSGGEKVTGLTRAQRASDAVTSFCGSWTFVVLTTVSTAVWIFLNHSDHAPDPYPFILFNLILTIVSTLQSPLIMMSQNRQIERDKQAAELQAELDRQLVRGLHEKLDELIGRKA